MDLPAWMAREGLNLTAAAKRLGIPVPSLHNYLGGQRRPSVSRAQTMAAATNGDVTVADLLPELAAAVAARPPAPCPADAAAAPGTSPRPGVAA